jgi:hypothetical protein
MSELSTEQRFFDEYDGMKSDLAHARQEILLLSNQLRDANTENEKMAYKVDFLTAEVSRITASREQYERVAIRVSAKMESGVAMMMQQLSDLQAEIQDAAFAKVPGTVMPPNEMPAATDDDVAAMGKRFGAGFGPTDILWLPQGTIQGAPQAREFLQTSHDPTSR